MQKCTFLCRSAMTMLLASAAAYAHADGLFIDKVYHPYVDALERELEFRLLDIDGDSTGLYPGQVYQVALGTSFGQSWFAEAYVIGERSADGNQSISAYEIELKKQLTEQGEYAVDVGILLEYENERKQDVQEFSAALLLEKEFGRWSATGNFFMIQEWGRDVENELETAVALKARYRYSRAFEPALEFYAGQQTLGLGPVIQGNVNLGVRKALHWQAGVILGLDDETPDRSYRLLLEYEF